MIEEFCEITPTAPVVELYRRSMAQFRDDLKALHILRQNVRALLESRHESEALLAQHLGFKHRSSLNKFLNSERAGFQMSRLDKLAGFFGLPVYQLFQPGISALTERRIGERRTARERRQGHAHRVLLGLAATLDPHRSPGKGRLHVAAASPLIEELRRLTEDHERKVTALFARAESGGQVAAPRRPQPRLPARDRTVRGPDPEKT